MTTEKIKKNGYSIEWFENGVMDPCFKLLTKQILKDLGKSGDYKTIIKNFATTEGKLNYESEKIIARLKMNYKK
jgi:hypothetical protein